MTIDYKVLPELFKFTVYIDYKHFSWYELVVC